MLQKTPLAETHQAMGGKMVDFGGWSMPVNYGSQIDEHHCVRQQAGMFDVSHMTIVDLDGDDAKAFLQYLLANDVDKLKTAGKALYTGMLNAQGGVIDDLIVYLTAWGYRLVVNCATREKDLAWITEQASAYNVQIQEREELSMIAVQGPKARDLVHQYLGDQDSSAVSALGVFSSASLAGDREDWMVARTGYTGEDGYEIMLPATDVVACWKGLAELGVKPCGLGARDTLRLEAGMNLYGHEMHDGISPLQANMAWTIAWEPESRDFIGRDVISEEKQRGITQKLVGLILEGRGVLREGYEIKVAQSDSAGVVTSGTFSPTLSRSIALARVPIESEGEATVIIRGKEVPAKITKPCFVRQGKILNVL